MLQVPRAVFFDVDGVLMDSLPQHLRICRDKAREFGLALAIPDPDEFRRMVARGTQVSPMLNFFLAVGFSERDAQRAVEDYEREFMSRYRPGLFAGVGRMLEKLHGAGIALGLVTSNTRANVEPALGKLMALFERQAAFFFDDYAKSMTKAQCLARGAQKLALPPAACTYVGDQPSDAVAARKAGFGFLGVTYGWGILPGTTELDAADDVSQIAVKLLDAGRSATEHLAVSPAE